MNRETLQFKNMIDSIPISSESPCSYFPGNISKVRAFTYFYKLPPVMLEYLLHDGFRRCGSLYYQTQCSSCKLCLSYRLPLDRFELTRSQKRALKRNQDLTVTFTVPQITEQKETMYLEYQYAQHFLKPVEYKKDRVFDKVKTLMTMYEQMYSNTHNTMEMELHLEGRLMGFAIIDVAVQSVSAVYSVYDINEKRRSLGKNIILKSIEWALKKGFKYYYLGYYIPGHSKMQYKAQFKPAEVRKPDKGLWYALY